MSLPPNSKYPEDAREAAEFLRQAVPWMVKNSIPPNPYNYALWYSYVSGRDPQLKQSLDQVLGLLGTCPPEKTEELFRRFILKDELAQLESSQDTISVIISEITESITESLTETKKFQTSLETQSSAVEQALTQDEVALIIQDLKESTNAVQASQNQLHNKLETAEKEVERLRQELIDTRRIAFVDSLTQVYNRLAFDKELAQLINYSSIKITLVMFDLDNFKSFNDDYGHLLGDRVLKSFATVLRESSPANALPSRFGGEEFAVILTNTSLSEGLIYAEDMRKKVSRLKVKVKDSGQVLNNISVSAGVAEHRPGEAIQSLIERADNALYRAKKEGRNRVISDNG